MATTFKVTDPGDQGQILLEMNDDGDLYLTGALYPAGNPNNAPRGANPQRTSGAIVIPSTAVMKLVRAIRDSSGSSPNLWESRVQGVLTGYGNEGGELRARGFSATSVAFRVRHAASVGSAQHVFEVVWDDDTTVLFSVDANGNITAAGTVTGTLDYSAWTNITNFAANAGTGTPTLQYRTEPGSTVRLRGQLLISGAGITSGNPVFTMPAGAIPAVDAGYTIRFLGTNATAPEWNLAATTGIMSVSNNLVVGNTARFEQVTYYHA